MARIAFHAAGYWGDVTPYVPIANELVTRGHDVVYALPRGLHALMADESFTVTDSGNPFAPDVVADDPEHTRLVERNGVRFGGALAGRYFTRTWLVPYASENVDALRALAPDLFVTHATSAATTRVAAESLRVPMVTGHLFPMILDTLARVPRPLWRVPGLATGDRELNAVRREHGLEPIVFNSASAALHDGMLLLWPAAFASSPRWPVVAQHTGFTQWRGPCGARLDPRVDAYLDDGDPVVVVTFGSSSAMVARLLFETFAVRLDDLGVRALFLVGNLANVTPSMRERPDVVAFAPLPDVLPRARAVVHSGSFGTTAAALTAGVPSIGVPLLIDQLWNARRIETLELGRVVNGRRRRTERVWAALDDVLTDDRYAARADAFARALPHD